MTTGTLAVAMLVAGRVSDARGRKPIMAASLFAVDDVMGVFGIAAAALFTALLPPSCRFEPEAGVSLRHLGGAFLGHLRDPGLAQLFAVGFLLMGAFVTAYNYLLPTDRAAVRPQAKPSPA